MMVELGVNMTCINLAIIYNLLLKPGSNHKAVKENVFYTHGSVMQDHLILEEGEGSRFSSYRLPGGPQVWPCSVRARLRRWPGQSLGPFDHQNICQERHL
jgi:hypothetical protein